MVENVVVITDTAIIWAQQCLASSRWSLLGRRRSRHKLLLLHNLSRLLFRRCHERQPGYVAGVHWPIRERRSRLPATALPSCNAAECPPWIRECCLACFGGEERVMDGFGTAFSRNA